MPYLSDLESLREAHFSDIPMDVYSLLLEFIYVAFLMIFVILKLISLRTFCSSLVFIMFLPGIDNKLSTHSIGEIVAIWFFIYFIFKVYESSRF